MRPCRRRANSILPLPPDPWSGPRHKCQSRPLPAKAPPTPGSAPKGSSCGAGSPGRLVRLRPACNEREHRSAAPRQARRREGEAAGCPPSEPLPAIAQAASSPRRRAATTAVPQAARQGLPTSREGRRAHWGLPAAWLSAFCAAAAGRPVPIPVDLSYRTAYLARRPLVETRAQQTPSARAAIMVPARRAMATKFWLLAQAASRAGSTPLD